MPLVRYMLRHPLAANLVMALVLLAGCLTLMRINTQFLPQFTLKIIHVTALWPGALAENISQSLLEPLEKRIRGLEALDFYESTARDHRLDMLIELRPGADADRIFNDVLALMQDRQDFPTDVEPIQVKRVVNYEPLVRILLRSQDDRALNYFANHLQNTLYDAGVDKVVLDGQKRRDLQVEVSLEQALSLGLTPVVMTQLLADALKSRPVGVLGEGHSERALDFEVDVRSVWQLSERQIKLPGLVQPVSLEELAMVRWVEDDAATQIYSKGQRAADLNLRTLQSANTLQVADRLQAWWQDASAWLPVSFDMQMLEQRWQMIRDRIALLVNNGTTGLLLIFLMLLLFFNARVAFWVSVGIPVSLSAALVVLYAVGGTINMISLFAMIMTLGIIVDDSVVIAEQAVSEFENQAGAEMAVWRSVSTMFEPIMAAGITTMAAFLPLLMLSSVMGEILNDIPMVALAVVLASLLECFYILPYHLKVCFVRMGKHQPSRWRLCVWHAIRHFQYHAFRRLMQQVVQRPGEVLLLFVCVAGVAYALVNQRLVGFQFFPQPPSQNIALDVRFHAGISETERLDYLHAAEHALDQALLDLKSQDAKVATVVYLNRAAQLAGVGGAQPSQGKQHGSILCELVSPDQRQVSNQQVKNAWLAAIADDPVVESLTMQESKGGPPGADLAIMLTGSTPSVLKQASMQLIQGIKKIQGVEQAWDDLPYGKQRWQLTLTPEAKSIGLSIATLSTQLRAAIHGIEVDDFYENGLPVGIWVKLNDQQLDDPSRLLTWPMLVQGQERLLGDLLDVEWQQSFATLVHYNGKLAVTVEADLDSQTTTLATVLERAKPLIAEIEARYGVKYSDAKQSRYERDTLPEIATGATLGLFLIYIVTAWVTRSLLWPLLVMVTIPLGIIGAIIGHYIMAMNLTLLSFFGLFGLAGIVVNGSIILLVRYQNLREEGMSVEEASVMAACSRFRALLLTTMTTIGGLLPLLFETSLQAQYLIPMATSLVFGLFCASSLMLLVIPAVIPLVERFSGVFQRS